MTPDGWKAQWEGRDVGFRVALLGVRGYFLNEGKPGVNDLGIYEDAIIRRIGEDLTLWRASVDPGLKYVREPMNPKGCASLMSGLWWYEIGEHKNHPALTQACPVVVRRLDREGRPAQSESGFFGLNIHSGGAEYSVGGFSAGCQVIQSPEGPWGETWKRFFDPLSAAMRESKQTRVPYLLVDALLPSSVEHEPT
ncbi:MAG: hypothetical protein ACOYMV_14650 [Verrucomicrobiia bacterium]